jgi:hypothetical protein
MNKLILILILLFLLLSNKKTETFNDILNDESDTKLKEILNTITDKSIKKNLLIESHKWCANMRNSASIITACIPLNDENDENEKLFPISVCCSSDYCEMKDKDNYPKFYYKENNGLQYLVKDSGAKQKIVQIIEEVENETKGIEHIQNNQDIYFPPITFERIEEICSI